MTTSLNVLVFVFFLMCIKQYNIMTVLPFIMSALKISFYANKAKLANLVTVKNTKDVNSLTKCIVILIHASSKLVELVASR